jgi:hypothetical protein
MLKLSLQTLKLSLQMLKLSLQTLKLSVQNLGDVANFVSPLKKSVFTDESDRSMSKLPTGVCVWVQ